MRPTLHFFILTLLFCSPFYFVLNTYGGTDRLSGYWMDSTYPKGIPNLLSVVSPILGERNALLALLCFFAVVAPAMAIRYFWGDKMGMGYLLSVGGMVMLVDNIAIAQAACQLLMILSLGNPIFYALFGGLGAYTHREWFGLFILTFIFDVVRRDYELVRLV